MPDIDVKLKPVPNTLYRTPFGTYRISMRKTSELIHFSFIRQSCHP